MSVKVINISQALEPILLFLYPTYSFTDSKSLTSRFITHRDIKSRSEREALSVYYSDCIFISSQIFDEIWDENKIKEECIAFASANYKSRRSKFPECSDFLEGCKKFIYNIPLPEESPEILELFDTFGSKMFVPKFISLTQHVSIPVLVSAMNTFISKVLNPDMSIYYRKKAAVLKPRIEANLDKAAEAMVWRKTDPYGLSYCKFYSDLVSE